MRGICDPPPAVSFSAPPTIWGSNETGEVAAMEGHAVRLLCEARGTPAPDVTWFKDGVLLPTSPEVVYTRGGRQLQLSRAQSSDAGVYTCKASNPVGVTEKATRLAVYGEQLGRQQGAGSPELGVKRDAGPTGPPPFPEVSRVTTEMARGDREMGPKSPPERASVPRAGGETEAQGKGCPGLHGRAISTV